MKKIILVLLLISIGSNYAIGQVVEPPEDDPFADDPFFNKPLKDWFSTELIADRMRRRSERIFKENNIDEGYRDLTGFGVNDGINELSKLNPYLRFNRVEGLYLGIHVNDLLEWDRDADFKLFGSAGYAFGREDWLYTIGAERYIGFSRDFKIGFTHYNITDSEDTWRTGWVENSLSSFFAGYDFMDYHDRQGTQFYAVLRQGRWMEFSLAFMDDSYSALSRNTRYSMFGKKSTYRDNPLIEEGHIRMVMAGFQVNPTHRLVSPNFAISADVYAELAGSFLGTDFAFNRIEAEARSTLRLDETAIVKSRLRAGAIQGTAPDFKRFTLGGISSLRATEFKSISGDYMLLLNNELFLGKRVGSRSDRGWRQEMTDQDNLRLVLFADMGWTNLGSKNAVSLSSDNSTFSDFRLTDVIIDVGVGVNFSTFRVELAWPSNQLSGTPAVWVRLNQTF